MVNSALIRTSGPDGFQKVTDTSLFKGTIAINFSKDMSKIVEIMSYLAMLKIFLNPGSVSGSA